MPPKRLAEPLHLRLDPPIKAALQAEADRRGIHLVDLVRERLDITAAVQGPLDTLRAELSYALGKRERAGAGGSSGGLDPDSSTLVDDALFIELVLAVRQLLNPTQRRDVKNDLVSLGLEPWTGQEVR